MTSKTEKDKAKQIQDKCQTLLNEMLRDEDNKYCVDCDSKGPRWASWNIGVFLCIRCAGIHRNLGVHISKVKSVNLDSWTPEQVVSLQQMGNSRARAVYEANLPDNFRRPQSDTSLESFVRAKYEHKKYIAREWVPPVIPKVDWEKEIDEEIERQKRKKKAAAASAAEKKNPIKITEVPQIPKPKNSSPKPSRITAEKVTQDLLGLQNGEDGFTGFLSGPSPAETKAPEKTVDPDAAARAEEESFFNQPAPTEKERTKLTKDSILALYASTPQTQPPQPMYNMPQTYPQQQNYMGAAAFPPQPTVPQSYAPVQNGMAYQPMVAGAQFQPQFPTQFPAQFMGTQPQQFTAPPTQFPQYPAQPQPFGFPQTGFGSQVVAPTAQQNPFFGTAPQGALQQQFAGLTLVGAQMPASKTGPPVATNLWQ